MHLRTEFVIIGDVQSKIRHWYGLNFGTLQYGDTYAEFFTVWT